MAVFVWENVMFCNDCLADSLFKPGIDVGCCVNVCSNSSNVFCNLSVMHFCGIGIRLGMNLIVSETICTPVLGM